MRTSPARDQIEQRLKATEERFRIAQVAGGIGWFEWDLETDAWEWTPHVAVLFGFDPETPRPQFADWQPAIFIDDVPKLRVSGRSCERERSAIMSSFGLRILTAASIGSPARARSQKTRRVGRAGSGRLLRNQRAQGSRKPDCWRSMRAWKLVSPIAPDNLPRPLPNWRKPNVGFTFSSMPSPTTRSSCSTRRERRQLESRSPADQGIFIGRNSRPALLALLYRGRSPRRACRRRRSQRQNGPENTKQKADVSGRMARPL